MKKIIALLGMAIVVYIVFMFINFENKEVTMNSSENTITREVDTQSQVNIYKEVEYGFEFSHPHYSDVVVATVPQEQSIKTIEVNMATLSGLNPLITLDVKSKKLALFSNTQAPSVVFRNTTAARLERGIAGGDFVIYEVALKDGQYLYIETDKHIVEGKFNEQFQGEQLERLNNAATAFSQLKNSFTLEKL
jgi:hypothetical protein